MVAAVSHSGLLFALLPSQIPYGPGPAGDVQRRAVPRRGWERWTLDMAETLIFTPLLEMISSHRRWK
jgi:hypothetical protein